MSIAARVSDVVTATHRDREGSTVVGVVAKRTYQVVDERASVSHEQCPLVDTVHVRTDGTLEHDVDVVVQRPLVDVIVRGYAYATDSPGAEISFNCGVGRRRIAVFGDRTCERNVAGRLSFSQPLPWQRIPLEWSSAYGGCDSAAFQRMGDPAADLSARLGLGYDPSQGMFGYPRNPAGRGYLIEPTTAALETLRLPNLEDPSFLLTPDNIVRGHPKVWPTAPPPACTGWLPHTFFPRSTQIGIPPSVYDARQIDARAFYEVRVGLLRASDVSPKPLIGRRPNLGVAQASAIGMRFEHLEPGSWIELIGVHPRHRSWRFRLPAVAPRMVVRLPGEEPRESNAVIRTLVVEPELERICAVWVTEFEHPALLLPDEAQRIQHAVIWPREG